MKNFFIGLSLLVFSVTSQAQTLETKPVAELIEAIKNSDFSYKETGLIFGFVSIKSCLYLSEDFAIFKNYCFPKKNYPAKGYVIFSAKFGLIDLYEETVGENVTREITQGQFSTVLRPYLTTPFPQASLSGLSSLLEKLYNSNNPACWSYNWNRNDDAPTAACSVDESTIVGFPEWSAETMAITTSDKDWAELMKVIESKTN